MIRQTQQNGEFVGVEVMLGGDLPRPFPILVAHSILRAKLRHPSKRVVKGSAM
jgi:hypothetical protein